jgi:hypothetical protein
MKKLIFCIHRNAYQQFTMFWKIPGFSSDECQDQVPLELEPMFKHVKNTVVAPWHCGETARACQAYFKSSAGDTIRDKCILKYIRAPKNIASKSRYSHTYCGMDHVLVSIEIKGRAGTFILQSWVGYFEPTLTWFAEDPFHKLPKSWSAYVNILNSMVIACPKAATLVHG